MRTSRLLLSLTIAASLLMPAASHGITVSYLSRYSTGIYNNAGSEIVAHDPATQRLFVIAGGVARMDVVSIASPAAPTLLFSVPFGPLNAIPNHVAVRNGVVAVACENAANKQAPGSVVFLDANGVLLNQLTAGALPDMCTFTPDGTKLLVANEGEPNSSYSSDPEGSVTVIDLTPGVAALTPANVSTIGFADFNVGGPRAAELPAGVRIYGPGATVAQDLEPEFIAVHSGSTRAFVTLQEANAIAELDLTTNSVVRIRALGYQDHSLLGKRLDPSDRDNAIVIGNWPVKGMYQPDGIATYDWLGDTYLVTANEGDAREYSAITEEVRVSTLNLDPTVFPNAATLKLLPNLGRLTVTNRLGDIDGDLDFDALHPLGGRSFSIWNASTGAQVYDSGEFFETHTAGQYPLNFNASNTNNTRDDRSDNKGPEPEGVVVASIGGRTYAFIGLERIGGVMVFDVSSPLAPLFVQYVNERDFAFAPNLAAALDNGPEGLLVIPASDSPNGAPLLVVGNEISGTTTLYRIDLPVSTLASLAHSVALEGRVELEWVVGVPTSEVAVERRIGDGPWARLGAVLPDGEGRVRFEDTDVQAGQRYGYRLALTTSEGMVRAAETQVLVPLSAILALDAARPNPVIDDLTLSFALASDAPASLRVFDAAGRATFVRDLSGLPAGRHTLRVDAARLLAPGVYLAVLEQGGARRSMRVAVVR